jgi:hypothetical protein
MLSGGAVVSDVDIALEVRRETIVTYYRPQEERAELAAQSQQLKRESEIASIRTEDHRFRVKLARLHLNDAQRDDCKANSSRTDTGEQTGEVSSAR